MQKKASPTQEGITDLKLGISQAQPQELLHKSLQVRQLLRHLILYFECNGRVHNRETRIAESQNHGITESRMDKAPTSGCRNMKS